MSAQCATSLRSGRRNTDGRGTRDRGRLVTAADRRGPGSHDTNRGDSVEDVSHRQLVVFFPQDPALFPETPLRGLQHEVIISLLVLRIQERLILAFVVIDGEVILGLVRVHPFCAATSSHQKKTQRYPRQQFHTPSC